MSVGLPEFEDVEVLRRRLEEAEETLRAIRSGEVDALVVAGRSGDQIFTLQGTDRTYRIFVERMSEGAATLSPEGVVLFANQRLADILGLPIPSIMGARIDQFVVAEHRASLTALRERGWDRIHAEVLFRTAGGRNVEVLVGLVPLPDERIVCMTVLDLTDQRAQEGQIRRLSEALATQVRELDVRNRELEEAHSELRHRAMHDGLTGIPNRELLMDRFRQALAQATRTGELTALFFVDLDRFKAINDSLGHEAGDVMLKEVARRLLVTIRPTDTVCRFGGDEFIVMAQLLSEEEQVGLIGERIREALACPHPGGSVLSASIGVATAQSGESTPEVMLREADTAMYQAKSRGGNRLEFFDPALGRQAKERLSEERAMRRALSDGRVLAYYQPVVDLASGRVNSLEALARVELEDGTVLPPARFLAVAEASGLVVPLGRQVLADACDRVSFWRRRCPDSEALRVNVNVSPLQLARDDLFTAVQDLLTKHALPAGALRLEITESAVIGAGAETICTLRRLSELGVSIGLDDFGTGYASLTQLRTLPIDFVKVDRSFIRGLNGERDDATIVAIVLDLARRLGLHSVAEGVEHPAQEARLVELGCDEVQGYLYSKPLPPASVAAALNPPELYQWRKPKAPTY